jgi:DNA topoisomerase-3
VLDLGGGRNASEEAEGGREGEPEAEDGQALPPQLREGQPQRIIDMEALDRKTRPPSSSPKRHC